jgi:hypothetical protein
MRPILMRGSSRLGSGLAPGRRRGEIHRRSVPTGSLGQGLAILVFLLAGSLGALATSSGEASTGARSHAAQKARWMKELAAQRERMMGHLHAYWTKGDFVQNPDQTGGPGHFILDGRGKPCPLASIIMNSGQPELVLEAARQNNGVKVVDLRDGPIVDWILHSGLTQEECVLIQRPSTSGADIAKSRRDEENRRLGADLEAVESTLRSSTERSLRLAVRRILESERVRRLGRS